MSIENEEMVPIPIREFVTGSIIPVDLFVKLPGGKFVLIAKEDSKTQVEQLRGYAEKNVDYLFVRKNDYNRYVGANIVIAGVVLSHNEITASKKAEFLHKASVAVMKEIDVLGMSHESFEHAKLVSQATASLVEAKSDLFGVLESLSKISDELLAHSVAVATVSVMIAKMQGWTKRGTYEKLSLGGLLHDIGMKELPPEILHKPRAQLTYEELQIYESHPFRGMEMLRTVPSVPDDVVSIVFEHHENAIGQGFPRKIRDIRGNPLAKVVALADTFIELTLKNPNTQNPKSAADAISYIEIIMGQPFNKESFTALKLLVKNAALPVERKSA